MTNKQKFSFPKTERLKHRKTIQLLFKEGAELFLYPFKTVYTRQTQAIAKAPEVLFSVSSKHFKKAVDRNWIKRRMREAYRQHKHLLADEKGFYNLQSLALIYVAKEKIPFYKIEQKLLTIFNRLKN